MFRMFERSDVRIPKCDDVRNNYENDDNDNRTHEPEQPLNSENTCYYPPHLGPPGSIAAPSAAGCATACGRLAGRRRVGSRTRRGRTTDCGILVARKSEGGGRTLRGGRNTETRGLEQGIMFHH